METSMVTTKGQVVIPAKIRKRYHIDSGTKIGFIEQGNVIIIRPITDDYIKSLKGILNTKGKALKSLIKEKQKERIL